MIGIREGSKRTTMAMMAQRPLCRLLSWRVARAGKRIALTFDDGPHPVFTPRVLDILAEHGTRATFFVLGAEVEKYPALLQRALAAGHEVGVHGYDHSLVELPRQMERTISIVRDLGGQPFTLRPPGGRVSAAILWWSVLKRMPLVLWSFDLEDSRRHEGKALRRRPFTELTAGDIVLMHDDNPVCVAELPDLLRTLKEKALEPTRVSDLLG